MISTQSCFRNYIVGISGTGSLVTETRTVENFSEIEVQNDAQIYITQTDSAHNQIRIEAQRNIISVLETEVFGNELILSYKKNVQIGRAHV